MLTLVWLLPRLLRDTVKDNHPLGCFGHDKLPILRFAHSEHFFSFFGVTREWLVKSEAFCCSFSQISIHLLRTMLGLSRPAAIRSPGIISDRFLDTALTSAFLTFLRASFCVSSSLFQSPLAPLSTDSRVQRCQECLGYPRDHQHQPLFRTNGN